MTFIKRVKGFFLVEVIVAFSLFAMVCGLLFSGWQAIQEKRAEQYLLKRVLDVAQDVLVCVFSHCPGEIEAGDGTKWIDGTLLEIKWTIADGENRERGEGWEQGRLEITWSHSTGKNDQLVFTVYRLNEV